MLSIRGSIRPKTIMPGTFHKLIGAEDPCVILEVSDHHDDSDVERLSCSKAGAVLSQGEQDALAGR